MLGKTEGKRRKGKQRMMLLNSITGSVDMRLSKFWGIVEDRGAWCAAGLQSGIAKYQTGLSTHIHTHTEFIYNAVLVSRAQQSDSALHILIHTSILFRFLPHIGHYWVLHRVLLAIQ